MEKAVEEQGLTRESYVSILTNVDSDADLRRKTIELIEEEKRSLSLNDPLFPAESIRIASGYSDSAAKGQGE